MTEFSNDDRLYLDDLHIGQRFTSGTHVVDEEQPSSHLARSAAIVAGAVVGEKPWPVDDLCLVEPRGLQGQPSVVVDILDLHC